ncbi:hypothetical protein FQN50_009010, partial [Emmonsiellopsis sp. PD_5]
MLADDAWLFFGPPRGAAGGGDGEGAITAASGYGPRLGGSAASAAMRTGKGGGAKVSRGGGVEEGDDECRDGGRGGDNARSSTATTTTTTIIEDVNAPDPLLRRDHLDILREGYSALRSGGERARRVVGVGGA